MKIVDYELNPEEMALAWVVSCYIQENLTNAKVLINKARYDEQALYELVETSKAWYLNMIKTRKWSNEINKVVSQMYYEKAKEHNGIYSKVFRTFLRDYSYELNLKNDEQ